MRQTFDRRSVLGLAVGSAAGAMFVSSARPTYAAGTAYKATLSGTTEVPPTTSSGTGTATVTYDSSTKMVTWEGDFSGLSGPATAAHIHGPAEAGKNAGVIVPLSQKDVPFTSPFTGSATLADDKAAALEAALSAGQAYVNVHTAANPGGEVRGQLGERLNRAGLLRRYQLRFCVTRRSCVSWTGGYSFVRQATLGAC